MALSEDEKKQLKDGLVNDFKDLFNQGDSTATTNKERSDFISGPAPASPLRRIGWDASRRACRRWAAGRGPSIAPWRDLFTRDICGDYIEDTFGPLGPATSAPPFPGGQCPKLYRVNGEWRTTSFLVCATGTTGGVGAWQPFSTEFNVLGPISGFSLSRITPACGGFDGHVITAAAADGPRIVFQRMGTGGVRREVEFRITSLEPASGADDCGSLPDDFDPGTGPTIPPETGPIPSPPGWEIPDFDIDITFNPDGTIGIDFGDGEPDITIDPGAPGGDGGGQLPPGDQGSAGSGGEAGLGEPAEGEAPPGSVLVGVRLQLIEAPPNAKKFAPTVWRGAAYVYMGGDVALDQDFAGSMLIDDQFIYAEKDNFTRWRVVANQGFRWQITPYYREVEE